jgi:hypothetical protein
MLKYLANTPPSTHLLLLVLIPLLRWPAFLSGYYQVDESLSLLVAERALSDGPLYVGTWFAGPPLYIWLYEGFAALFGQGALLALRIFAGLWIYLMAVYVNGIIGRFKVFRRYEGLPGLLLAVLASVPWWGLQLSSELLAMWPLLVAYNRLLNLSEVPRRNYGLMFQAGALIMVAVLVNYQAIFFLGGGLVAYLLLRTVRLDELTAGLGGILVTGLALVGVLYLNGNLRAYEEIGLQYYFQRLGASGSALYPFTSGQTLLSMASTWGMPLLLTGIGFIHFRLRFFNYVVKIRSVETIMALWLAAGLLMLLAKWRRLDLSDFHLLLPPVAFYTTKVLDFRWPLRLRLLTLTFTLGVALLSYLSGWSLRFPDPFSWLPVASAPTWLYGPREPDRSLPSGLQTMLSPERCAEGIWIMDHQPHWYLALGAPCANRYVDFRMAYYKFSMLPGQEADMAQPEAEERIFRAFQAHPPSYVIDPYGWFPAMMQRYPSLFAGYQSRQTGKIVVYSRVGWTASQDL